MEKDRMSAPGATVRASWTQRERGTFWLMRLMLLGLRVLSRPVMFPFVEAATLYFFLSSRRTRNASLDYLRHVAAAAPESGIRPTWRHAYRHFRTFGQAILDKVDTWSGRLTVDDVTFDDHAEMARVAQGSRGIMVLGSHLGNLEVLRALGTLGNRVKLNVLVHTAHAESFNRTMRLAGATDVELVQVTQLDAVLALDLRQRVDRGEWVVIAGDRIPVHGGRTVDVTFLGDRAPLPIGPYVMASLLDCPVYLMFVLRRDGRNHAYFEPFAERVTLPRQSREAALAGYAQKYTERLEHYLRLAPLQWFNYYAFWKH
jgi:predicted LPLAT superfamily acyltransferase